MGVDIERLQDAYRGFARGNFTMLDNLSLGYAGTKEEMERLLADAEKISGIEYDISSYADITEAIHVVQTEMGITGTTAEEAASTIQGSLSMMKGAWANLLTGLADENADFDALMGNFVDSVVTVGENLMPRIEKTIQGIAKLVSSASKTIIPLAIKTLMKELPNVVRAGADVLITALLTTLTSSLTAH